MATNKGDISFKIEGAAEAAKVLKTLPLKMQAKILYKINRKAGAKVAKKLRDNAPSQNIKKGVKITRSKNNRLTGVWIGFKSLLYYVRFLEFGTDERTTKSGAYRGKMKEQPFIQKSHDQAMPEIKKLLSTGYQDELNKILEREKKLIDKKIMRLKSKL